MMISGTVNLFPLSRFIDLRFMMSTFQQLTVTNQLSLAAAASATLWGIWSELPSCNSFEMLLETILRSAGK